MPVTIATRPKTHEQMMLARLHHIGLGSGETVPGHSLHALLPLSYATSGCLIYTSNCLVADTDSAIRLTATGALLVVT